MKTEMFVLCEYAKEDHGVLSLINPIDRLSIPWIGAPLPQFSVALRFRFTREERGRHLLSVRLISPSGDHTFTSWLQERITLDMPEDVSSRAYNFAGSFDSFLPREEGQYKIVASLGEEQLGCVPLYVVAENVLRKKTVKV